jgi:hypothetical protein
MKAAQGMDGTALKDRILSKLEGAVVTAVQVLMMVTVFGCHIGSVRALSQESAYPSDPDRIRGRTTSHDATVFLREFCQWCLAWSYSKRSKHTSPNTSSRWK